MKFYRLQVLVVVLVLSLNSVTAMAAVRIGLVGPPDVPISRSLAEELTGYLQRHSGESVELRSFGRQAELLAWIERHQALDLALLTGPFLAQQPRGRYQRLLSAEHPDHPLVWIARGSFSGTQRARLFAALQGMPTTDAGKQLLRQFDISGWAAQQQLTEASVPARKAAELDSAGTRQASNLLDAAKSASPPAAERVAAEPLAEQLSAASVALAPDERPGATYLVPTEKLPVSQLSTDQAAPAAGVSLSLRQAEKIALRNNLNLLAETYNTRASEAVVARGYGVYDPLLGVDLFAGQRKQQINSQAFSGLTQSDFFSLDAGITQKLSTGAELSLGFFNRREDITSVVVPPVNPQHTSDLTFSLVQPLMEGFGRTVTEQEILLSIKDREASVQDLRNQVFTLLAEVRNTYYEALRTRDDLAAKEASVRVAEQVLKENRARVDVGVLPKVELLEAEVGLKSRQRDLLDADRAYRNTLDQLALLLDSDQPLQPSMALEQAEIVLDEEAGYRNSLIQRPEVQRRLRELERFGLEQTLNRDQLKPNLDLLASYGQQGIGEGFDNSLSGIAEDDQHHWQFGLSFSYPLGNRTARSDLQRTRVLTKGKQAELRQLKADIRTEIRLAIRQVQVAGNKIEVAQSERSLAEEKLAILLGRKEVGLATTRDVLEGEQDLANAQSGLVTSLADYNKAVTEYLRVTGFLLEHEGVRFAGVHQPDADGSAFALE